MTPQARDEMGRKLLAEMSLYVSPPPPPGNHPEYVLAAILADRRRRDTVRLARDRRCDSASPLPTGSADRAGRHGPAVAPPLHGQAVCGVPA